MMNTYPMVEQICLFIDENMAAAILLTADQRTNQLPEPLKELLKTHSITDIVMNKRIPEAYQDNYQDIEMAGDLLEDLGRVYTSSFEGSICTFQPDQISDPLDKSLDDDYIVYLQTAREPDLFHAAYHDLHELEQEFRDRLTGLLPADFPIRRYLVSLNGTYVA